MNDDHLMMEDSAADEGLTFLSKMLDSHAFIDSVFFKQSFLSDGALKAYMRDLDTRGYVEWNGKKIFLNHPFDKSFNDSDALCRFPEKSGKRCRTVKYSDGRVFEDPLLDTLAPNPIRKFGFFDPTRDSDFYEKATSKREVVSCDEKEFCFTKALRDEIVRRRYQYQNPELARFFKKPMASAMDGIAFPTLPGRTVDFDYLLQSDPIYPQLMTEIFEAFATGDEEADKANSVMLSYWNIKTPLTTFIRKDKNFETEKQPGSLTLLALQDFWVTLLVDGFQYLTTDYGQSIPHIKGNKSIGPDAFWPDGKRFDKHESGRWWRKVHEKFKKLLSVTNTIVFRLTWIRSDKMKEKLQWFFQHCHEYWTKPAVVVEAFFKGCIGKCFALERLNNQDTVDVDSMTIKARVGQLELKNGKFLDVLFDPVGLQTKLKEVWLRVKPEIKKSLDFIKQNFNVATGLSGIKARLAYSFNHATWGVIFIHFYKIWFNRLEHSASGLPSLSDESKKLYDAFCACDGWPYQLWVKGDTTSNETWLTTFFDSIVQMVPEGRLRDVFKAVNVHIQPSAGPYVTFGNVSGCAGTTGNTIISGVFRWITFLAESIYGEKATDSQRAEISRAVCESLLFNMGITEYKDFSDLDSKALIRQIKKGVQEKKQQYGKAS